MPSVPKHVLVNYLDTLLSIREIADSSQNGLQVDNARDTVSRLAYGVDATTYLIDRARDAGADMLLVHHGTYWASDRAPAVLTGLQYARVSRLIHADMALYGAHLPLDAHGEYGNNSGIANALVQHLGFPDVTRHPFYRESDGTFIGVGLRFEEQQDVESLLKFMDEQGFTDTWYPFADSEAFNNIAIVSGGGGRRVGEAVRDGYDVYLTGEMTHSQIHETKELGISIALGGHYETETIGVRLLAAHIADTFGIETVFVDEKY